MNYKYLTGPFIGEVVEEGYQALQSFDQLDEDMKNRVRIFAEDHGIADMNDAVERYETSWESEPTDEKPTMW